MYANQHPKPAALLKDAVNLYCYSRIYSHKITDKTTGGARMKKTIKKTSIIVLIVICSLLIASVVGYQICQRIITNTELEAAEREALLEKRVREVLATSENEKESLLARIDELMAEEVVVFDAAPIKEQILDIGELSTVTYHYTEVGTFDSAKYSKQFGFKIPFSSKEIVVSMDGVIKVGVNVKEINIITDESTKTITVSIPAATIMSHELDENSLQVLVEKDSLFSNITLEDSSDIRINIKSQAEEKAKEYEILNDARYKAGEMVKNLIEAVPGIKDTYTIVIQFP